MTSCACSKPRASLLPTRPEIWGLKELLDADLGRTMVVATRSVMERAAETLPFEIAGSLDSLSNGLDTLIAIGGGTLIDEAKAWRAGLVPRARLIAIPSLWGSGAEVSPVAVLNRRGRKEIQVGEHLIPDVRCRWPELALSLPDDKARYACGDVWAHALEGFLSPLATDELRQELADLIREILDLPIGNDPRWFEPSARACAAQARSGVGLVHGIAHTLEGYLRVELPETGWGHAMLCSLFLRPVMEFNRRNSPKWERLMQEHELDEEVIIKVLEDLHESGAYALALPLLERHWMEILRDPCSRTNSALIRPASKGFFVENAVH